MPPDIRERFPLPIFTDEEKQEIFCAMFRNLVYAERRDNHLLGTPLSDAHKDLLRGSCGEIDFDKWVIEDEANKEANHRAFEALKARLPKGTLE